MSPNDEQLSFIDWYANEFNSGAVNARNYVEAHHYLKGFMDALDVDPSTKERLERCAHLLHDASCVLDNIKRYGVMAPDKKDYL